jgi:hypothetical protein
MAKDFALLSVVFMMGYTIMFDCIAWRHRRLERLVRAVCCRCDR